MDIPAVDPLADPSSRENGIQNQRRKSRKEQSHGPRARTRDTRALRECTPLAHAVRAHSQSTVRP